MSCQHAMLWLKVEWKNIQFACYKNYICWKKIIFSLFLKNTCLIETFHDFVKSNWSKIKTKGG